MAGFQIFESGLLTTLQNIDYSSMKEAILEMSQRGISTKLSNYHGLTIDKK